MIFQHLFTGVWLLDMLKLEKNFYQNSTFFFIIQPFLLHFCEKLCNYAFNNVQKPNFHTRIKNLIERSPRSANVMCLSEFCFEALFKSLSVKCVLESNRGMSLRRICFWRPKHLRCLCFNEGFPLVYQIKFLFYFMS